MLFKLLEEERIDELALMTEASDELDAKVFIVGGAEPEPEGGGGEPEVVFRLCRPLVVAGGKAAEEKPLLLSRSSFKLARLEVDMAAKAAGRDMPIESLLPLELPLER